MIQPPRWKIGQLEKNRRRSISLFREERLQEPVDLYTSAIDDQLIVIKELLSLTSDLVGVASTSLASVLSDPKYRSAFRYLAGPPISEDDWETLAQVNSFSNARLKKNPELAAKLAEVVLNVIDRRRFPWVAEGREPSAAERDAAILASACLWAYQRTQTARRSTGKERLEGATEGCLIKAGFAKVERRKITLLQEAPVAGEFCCETNVADRRADFVVGLWDGRHALIECKDSNSLVNSIKRLNNDTAAKATFWIRTFGERSAIPIAVISGVYHLDSLSRAQDAGLTIFWGHAMNQMESWFRSIQKAQKNNRSQAK